MITNNDRIHEELEDVYSEGAKATGTILEAVLQAIQQAKRDRDAKTLEISQENSPVTKKPLSLSDLTIESTATIDSPKPAIEDLTIEQDDRKRKVKETDALDSLVGEKKILFGMSDQGFVNNMSSAQEKAIGQMLMNKPGTEIPGAENLVIRYKGEIIASTNDKGVLEANELYGKIPPATLQRLAEEVAKTPSANAPRRAAPVIKDDAKLEPPSKDPVESIPQPLIPNQVVDSSVPSAVQPVVDTVATEPRVPRPIKKAPILDGNPITQVQAALAGVAVAGNGVANLAAEIQSTTVDAVAKAVNPLGIDPKSVVGVAAISTGKAAGIMSWIEANAKDGHPAISPNGYVGEIGLDHNNDKVYTLKDPKGGVVLSGTETLQLDLKENNKSTVIQIETYSSKGIGKEWEAIKKSQIISEPETKIESPVVESTPEINRSILPEELVALKNIADKYVVKEGIDKQLAGIDSNPDLLLGYEKLPNGKTEYSLYDKTDPYAKVSFTYDEKNGNIQDVKQTTTPSMLSLVEKANAHMRQENIEIKDAADRVNIAEDREPGTQAAAPVVTLGNEIPLSSVPTPTAQAPEVTEKLSQQQIATISKSIAIVDATCLDQDNREADLEHTRVSIEDKDRNTKLYTIKDPQTKEESQFSHNKNTGEIVVYKESDTVSKLIDKEEQIFSPVIPGYPEIVKTTSKQIEKGGEMTITAKGKGEITKLPSRKPKAIER